MKAAKPGVPEVSICALRHEVNAETKKHAETTMEPRPASSPTCHSNESMSSRARLSPLMLEVDALGRCRSSTVILQLCLSLSLSSPRAWRICTRCRLRKSKLVVPELFGVWFWHCRCASLCFSIRLGRSEAVRSSSSSTFSATRSRHRSL